MLGGWWPRTVPADKDGIASGLIKWGRCPVAMVMAMALSRDMSARTGTVAEPRCGSSTVLGHAQN